jgi:hypothetical protein
MAAAAGLFANFGSGPNSCIITTIEINARCWLVLVLMVLVAT